jgi:phosphatidylserine decarboxylase precursor
VDLGGDVVSERRWRRLLLATSRAAFHNATIPTILPFVLANQKTRPLANYFCLITVRKLLRSMSFKQGKKYDDPASASQIPGFINFHQLDMSEVLLPVSDFKTFNEFFYRELKPGARPCSAPDVPQIVVSPADCRCVVFNKLEEAQKVWVKGRGFSVERLLGNAYPEEVERYKGGASLGIFRLAPQDYHRFHIPVDGVLGEPRTIEGEYYTVNPMAIRSALDVYGENVRVLVPIQSEVFGRVMVVCVGAMLVGSTVITRKKGEKVKRAEELGYFKFGGSTLLVLFEPGVMRWDEDLVANSQGALETLVSLSASTSGPLLFLAILLITLMFLCADPSRDVRRPLPEPSALYPGHAEEEPDEGGETRGPATD